MRYVVFFDAVNSTLLAVPSPDWPVLSLNATVVSAVRLEPV